jgi:hypothetical protein
MSQGLTIGVPESKLELWHSLIAGLRMIGKAVDAASWQEIADLDRDGAAIRETLGEEFIWLQTCNGLAEPLVS